MANMDKENSFIEQVNNIRLMALVSQMFIILYLCSTWTKCEGSLTRETVLDIASTKYDKSWAVQLQQNAKEQDVYLIARTLGLNYRKILPNNYYLLSDENNEDLLDEPNSIITEALKLFPKVIWAEQQAVEDNDVRDIYSDPLWSRQEYLKSTARSYSISHHVEDVWKKGYTGKGVTVAVIDDGVRGTHRDFENRYDSTISTDIAKGFSETRARHGTKCAGVIAAVADNSWCGVGVAFDSKITGIRLFNNLSSTDAQEAQAFYNESIIKKVDIFSNSWGPNDNGYRIRAPGKFAAKALEWGTTKGRNGLGSVYLFSAGNGGQFGDSCAFDGYVNSIYTIAVTSVAQDGKVPVFSEPCAAIMTAVYSAKNIVTLSSKSDTECVSDFGRTSAASAFVAGILALALQANRNLTWRDVQHLIARSSTWKGVNNDVHRVTNGKKFTVGKYFGFGILDALTLINKAKTWKNSVPEQVKCTLDITSLYGESQSIPKQLKLNVDHRNLKCSSKVIESLEHVQIRVDLHYSNRALLSVDVESPSGTNSKFIYPRAWDALTSRTSYSNLVVTSVHFWGEPVVGEWTVNLKEDAESTIQRYGTLFNLTFIFFGTSEVIADNDSTLDDKDDDDEDIPEYRKTTSTTARSSSKVGVTTEDSQEFQKSIKPWLIIVIVIGCLIVVGAPALYFLLRHFTKPVRCSSPHEKKLEDSSGDRTGPPDTRRVENVMV